MGRGDFSRPYLGRLKPPLPETKAQKKVVLLLRSSLTSIEKCKMQNEKGPEHFSFCIYVPKATMFLLIGETPNSSPGRRGDEPRVF